DYIMIVRNSIAEGKKGKLALAAGLVVIQNNKILLIHPKGSSWWKTYSIPKGHVEAGEGLIDAAKRETNEETGIDIDNLRIEDKSHTNFVDYTDKKGVVYKRVYYFVAEPKKPISAFKLQKKEVDWAGFLGVEEAKKRIHPRFNPLLKILGES
ncbi:MAG: NUDIX domain-containing protein, partial [Chloroflexia bacterium]|nr:NUDIX domain-containing protein [Chloroflexia bacterium]